MDRQTKTTKHRTWLMMTIADNLSDKFDFDELAPANKKGGKNPIKSSNYTT